MAGETRRLGNRELAQKYERIARYYNGARTGLGILSTPASLPRPMVDGIARLATSTGYGQDHVVAGGLQC
jgi:hypothetical protein